METALNFSAAGIKTGYKYLAVVSLIASVVITLGTT